MHCRSSPSQRLHHHHPNRLHETGKASEPPHGLFLYADIMNRYFDHDRGSRSGLGSPPQRKQLLCFIRWPSFLVSQLTSTIFFIKTASLPAALKKTKLSSLQDQRNLSGLELKMWLVGVQLLRVETWCKLSYAGSGRSYHRTDCERGCGWTTRMLCSKECM